MSELFAPHATRLCGALCRQLSWRPPDFWSATPAEIAAIFTDDTAGDQPWMDRDTLIAMMERDGHG